MTFDLESLQQEGAIWPWLDNNSMADMNYIDNNYNADLLDAMADMAHEQEQAMRESQQTEWSLIEDNGTFVGFQTINEWEGVIYDDEDAP